MNRLARLGRHLQLAAAQLAAARLHALATTLILAVAIAVIAAAVSLNTLLLARGLPYAQAAELVDLRGVLQTPGGELHGGNAALAAAWIDALQPLGRFELALSGAARVEVLGLDRRAAVSYVGPQFFALLGSSAAAGRTFDQLPAASLRDPVAVLGAGLAVEIFGSAAAALDRFVLVDGRRHLVVGVMADGFRSPQSLRGSGEALWLPLSFAGLDFTNWQGFVSNLSVFGRVGDSAARAALPQRLEQLTAGLLQRHAPARGDGTRISARALPLRDAVIGQSYRAGLILLLAATTLAALGFSIASSMLLARLARRRAALAMHSALGARRGDLLLHVLGEMLLTMLAALLLAVPLAWLLLQALRALGQGTLPRLDELALDAGFFAVLAAAGIAAAAAVSFAAVRRLRRLDIAGLLQRSGKGGVGGELRSRQVVLGAQLFLVMAALYLGALSSGDALRRIAESPGFAQDGASFLQVELPGDARSADAKRDAAAELGRQLVRELGIQATVLSDMPPVSRGLALFDARDADGQPLAQLQVNGVGDRYLPGLQVALRAGRYFAAQEYADLAGVLVLGASAANLLGGPQQALGRRLQIDGQQLEVVGVVDDIVNPAIDLPGSRLQGYVPFRFYDGVPTVAMLLLHPGQAAPPAARVQGIVRALGRGLFLDDYRPIAQLRGELLRDYRYKAVLAAALVLLTVLLAVAGVFALTAYIFHASARSVAIRLALGARRADLLDYLTGAVHRPALAALGVFLVLAAATGPAAAGLFGAGAAPLAAAVLAAAAATLLLARVAARLTARRLLRSGYGALLSSLQ
jgi:putative ABC transport system permease protein